MTIPTKATIGALTLGSVGIAGYAASPYFKTESKQQEQELKPKISDLINDKYEYISLDTTKTGAENKDKTYWDAIWKEYKTKNNNVFGLANWENKETEDLTEKLKAKCSNLLNSNVNDDKDANYQNYTKYCARGVTIADEAGKLKWDVLDTKESDGKNEDIWAKRESVKSSLEVDLTLLGIEKASATKTTIKNGCKTITTKKKQDENYSKILDAYKKVCTKQSTDTQ